MSTRSWDFTTRHVKTIGRVYSTDYQNNNKTPFVNADNIQEVLRQIPSMEFEVQQNLLKKFAYLNKLKVISFGLDDLMNTPFTDVDSRLIVNILKELSTRQDKKIYFKEFNKLFFTSIFQDLESSCSFDISNYKPLDKFTHKCKGITEEVRQVYIKTETNEQGIEFQYCTWEYLVQLKEPLVWKNGHIGLVKRYHPQFSLPNELSNSIACEGRGSDKTSDKTGKSIYWCRNDRCFEPCREPIKTSYGEKEKYWEYTLLDIAHCYGISISDELLGSIYSYVNKLYAIKHALQCKKCKKLIYPVATSNYAYDNFNLFNCRNQECSEYDVRVYLAHCLNPKCQSLIDDRVSKRCSNGWVICDKCNCCCSDFSYDKRLSMEKHLGIHANLKGIPHLHREVFCHKCGILMDKISHYNEYFRILQIIGSWIDNKSDTIVKVDKNHKWVIIKQSAINYHDLLMLSKLGFRTALNDVSINTTNNPFIALMNDTKLEKLKDVPCYKCNSCGHVVTVNSKITSIHFP